MNPKKFVYNFQQKNLMIVENKSFGYFYYNFKSLQVVRARFTILDQPKTRHQYTYIHTCRYISKFMTLTWISVSVKKTYRILRNSE